MEEVSINDYKNNTTEQTVLTALQLSFNKGLISLDTFEKAKRDLSKLKQEIITDKNGQVKKVWVMREEEHPAELKHKKGDTVTTKDGRKHTVIGYKGSSNGKTDGHLYTLQDEKGDLHDKFEHNLKAKEQIEQTEQPIAEQPKTSETPLRDEWQKRLDTLDKDKKYTADSTNIPQKGDYVLINNGRENYQGFVESIGSKNVSISSSYGGWGDSDYISILKLNFPKSQITHFIKPKTVKTIIGDVKVHKLKPTTKEQPKINQTDVKVLKEISQKLLKRYGLKKSSNIYDAGVRLVDPNRNNITDITFAGVEVDNNNVKIFKPFLDTDLHHKKWILGTDLKVD
jgi:plastocyanin